MGFFKKADVYFLAIVAILTVFGFILFLSAAMGLSTRGGVSFYSVVITQTVIGLFGGMVAFLIASRLKYTLWQKWSFYFFLGSVILTTMVFLPQISLSHGGATRWIEVGGFSFQPGEILKLAYILYLGAWLSKNKDKITTFTFGFVPFMVISAIPGLLLLLQPDTDNFALMFLAGLSMFFIAGARWKHIFLIMLIGLIGFIGLVVYRPYLFNRFVSYLNPLENYYTTGYQAQQSLIAIGSGGLTGRGFGQSLQKFKYLPEPIGDSVFAVAGEEFGLLGTILLITVYLAFLGRGLYIGANAEDMFGRLTASGIVILITSQAYLNIASMLALVPISGLPLVFISKGGTALLVALLEVGIVLNISKFQKRH